MKIDLQRPYDRDGAAHALRVVRSLAREDGDYVLSVRAWRNRAAIKAASWWRRNVRRAHRCKRPDQKRNAMNVAEHWDRVSEALEKGWDKP